MGHVSTPQTNCTDTASAREGCRPKAAHDAGGAGSGPFSGGAVGSLSRYTAKLGAARPDDAVSASRLVRFMLQREAARLVPHKRVAHCLNTPIGELHGSGSVSVHAHNGDAWLAGLQTCGSVWDCPVCAVKVSECRREELSAAISTARARGLGVYMLTYTASHARSDDLSGLLGAFLAASRSMTMGRAYKAVAASWGVLGTVKALEVTWGGLNGWHPHCHVFLFSSADLNAEELRAGLFPAWSAALSLHGLTATAARGLDVRATYGAAEDYLAKWGRVSSSRAYGAEDELLKAHVKRARGHHTSVPRYSVLDMLRATACDGFGFYSELWREYSSAFHRRHQLQWSRGLRSSLDLSSSVPDTDLSAVTPSDTFFAALLSEEWYAVRWVDARARVLSLARAGDSAGLSALVADLYARYCSEYLGVAA